MTQPMTEELWGIVGTDSDIRDDDGELIGNYLDQLDADDLPRTFQIQRYERMKPRVGEFAGACGPLEAVLDQWNESEYHDPEKSSAEPTVAMLEAQSTFIAAVLKELQVWACVPVKGTEQTIDVLEWARDQGEVYAWVVKALEAKT